MSLATDLIVYLDALVSETAGTDLFEGPSVELPDNTVIVTHYGGEAVQDRTMGASLTTSGVEVGSVQVLVRNTVMATALTRAEVIHALLDNFNGTWNSRTILQCISINGMPFSMGTDKLGRFRYVANFRVQFIRP